MNNQQTPDKDYSKSGENVAIVIPSLNPQKELVGYIRDLRIASAFPIIVVDDGSDEKYATIFDECASIPGVILLKHDVNHGKGRALKTAFSHILKKMPFVMACVCCDSDGQHTVSDVLKAAHLSIENPEAVVLGCRTFDLKNVPWRSRFGNHSFRLLFRLTTGLEISDTQTGLRALPASFMEELLQVPGERYEFETYMLLEIKERQLIQYPIETVYINENQSSHFSPFCDSSKIVWVLLKSVFCNFGRFIISSLLSFGVDISLFYVLFYKVFKDNLSSKIFLSVAIARVVSLAFNYLLNRYYVFSHNGKGRSVIALGKYVLLAIFQWLASYGLLKLAICFLGFANNRPTFTKTVIDLLLFFVSYIIQRSFVFSCAAKSKVIG